MDLSTLIKTARGRYGSSRLGGEDALFHDVAMMDAINEAHRWFAEYTRCYRQGQTYDLPLGASGVSTVALECNVIDLRPETIRASVANIWRPVYLQDQERIDSAYGVPENRTSGQPAVAYTTFGDTLEAQRVLCLVPGSDTAVTGGLKLTAEIYPAWMSAPTDAPALQPAEHFRLIPAICQKMAELDLSRGRPDAPLAYWQGEARREADALRRTLDRFRRGGQPRAVHYRAEYHSDY